MEHLPAREGAALEKSMRRGDPNGSLRADPSNLRERVVGIPVLLPTPEAKLGDSGPDYARAERERSGADDLATAVHRDLLPTPQAHDAQGGKTPEQVAAMRERTGAGVRNLNEVAENELFPTPTAGLGMSGQKSRSGARQGEKLLGGIAQELLPTPSTSNANGNHENNRGDVLLPGAAERVELLPTPTAADENASGGGTPTDVTLTDAVVRTELGAIPNPRHEPALLPTPVTTDANHVGPADANRDTVQLRAIEFLLPTPTTQEGHSGPSQATRNTPPLNSEVLNLLPTPVAAEGEKATYQQTADEKAATGQVWLTNVIRTIDDASGVNEPEVLLPTPAASLHNDSEDASTWQARHDLHAGKEEGATRSGMPLPVAVQQTGDDSTPADLTEDGEHVRWGKYRAGILRAQIAAQRLAPSPTRADGKGGKRRLAARFVEWMMLVRAGWVTDAPGITRQQQLKMLGNGVVPPQASAATVILLARVSVRLEERRARTGQP